MKTIKVKCPAKVNLTLEILNKREDGFHNIQSVMQTIDLFDILTINIEKNDKFEIKLTGTSDEIPYDERNLVYKAAELFMNALDPSPLEGEGGWKPDEGFKELLKERAKYLRNNLTKPEDVLWYYLRDRRFVDLKFRRQVPMKNYILDFVCFEKKIIIELDGGQHLEEKASKYDIKRDNFFRNQGFKVLRFYNNEVFNNLEGVLEVIYLSAHNENYIQPIESRDRTMSATQTLNPLTPSPSPTRGEGRIINIKPFSIHIHIEKNIPIAAGLAGGSTDAAGTLWGLNKLYNNVLSDEELHELCAQLGSDLNFCLEGGCQLTTGRGEILEKLPFQEFSLSLIKPKNLGISAKEAYTKFSELENKPNLNMTEKLVDALKKGNADLDDFLQNDLELALVKDYKELRAIRMEYPEALMSGSGSTFFAIETEFKDFDDSYWIKSGLKSIPYGVSEL